MKIRCIVFLYLKTLIIALGLAHINEDEHCEDAIDIQMCPFQQNSDITNVAKGSLAVQSTTYKHGGAPNLAVDGKKNQQFWIGKTCSHTAEHIVKNETFPWLRLDLKKRHLIRQVRLYSRSDPCCADRYHDIQIRVGNYIEDKLGVVFSRNGLCAEIKGGGYEKGHIFNFTCVPCLAGQYISVQIVNNCTKCKLPHYNILSICELEVYGFPV